MTIGDRIKQRREQLGMTQEELAKKLGYASRSSVNKVEKSRELSNKKVKLYSDALKCTPVYLMGWDEELISHVEDIFGKDSSKLLQDFIKLNDNYKDLLLRYLKNLIKLQNLENRLENRFSKKRALRGARFILERRGIVSKIKSRLEERKEEYEAAYRESLFPAAVNKAEAFGEAIEIIENLTSDDSSEESVEPTPEEVFCQRTKNWQCDEVYTCAIEELAELIQALCKIERIDSKPHAPKKSFATIVDNYIEELADVELSLAVLKHRLSSENLACLQEWKKKKIERES